MADNNLMYQMYKQMVQGYKLGEAGNNLFEHSVICWMNENPDNPFPEDTEAFEYFFQIKKHYSVWKLGGPDKKISVRRMLNSAKDLCAAKTKNPYKYDKKAAEEERALNKEAALKSLEEATKALQEAELRKAEHEEEVRQIMEELKQFDIDNHNRIDDMIANEANIKAQIKNKELQSRYVFNVDQSKYPDEKDLESDEPKKEAETEKKGWLKRLLRR